VIITFLSDDAHLWYWEGSSSYLFMTALNSRMNSWVSWFILNLKRNKQISLSPCTLNSLICNELETSWVYYICTFIHTWAAILCSLANMSIRVQRFLNLNDIYPSLETCWPVHTPSSVFEFFYDVFTAELLK
jgi:hypothetical protein